MSDVVIDLDAQIVEVRRELGARRRLYPRWVEDGRMPEHVAAQRLAAMEAVLATLKALDEPELAL